MTASRPARIRFGHRRGSIPSTVWRPSQLQQHLQLHTGATPSFIAIKAAGEHRRAPLPGVNTLSPHGQPRASSSFVDESTHREEVTACIARFRRCRWNSRCVEDDAATIVPSRVPHFSVGFRSPTIGALRRNQWWRAVTRLIGRPTSGGTQLRWHLGAVSCASGAVDQDAGSAPRR